MSITIEENGRPVDLKECEICGVLRENGKYFFSQQPRKPVLEDTVKARVCQYINREVHGDKTCLCKSPTEKLPNKFFDGMEYGCEYDFDSIRNPDDPPSPYTIPTSY